ncbi:hypothetical protein ABB37_01240 [Leptomonas pyrrhocoris]|uniref:Uncharacterized protein n=1 Tax=Leptomonas pyrrhocoris TaxID=157538 RepID=A0A0M9G8M0_LEPPY|nr:hypothetical protein ABB37_01240 [Leptomonas pyrrhocoris]KPA84746.1 hypothetical protein ABB37_01240 [Leptomonas pyrrhocoris]|eukprot:XP_015663185.1 hypothetical protein ABB37_01240 [Leptomonas pyrrhocoris]
MSMDDQRQHFHVVIRESQAVEVVVPLPFFCKPLAASIRPYGGGEAGLLASYYDPEQHAWVVRQLPLHESWPHHPPPLLVVRVVTLVDPTNLYELRVALASVLDGIANDDLYALQRRSQLYGLFVEEHLADKSGATLQAAAVQGQLPHLSEAVSLAAPLEVMEGFVLTGGGFLSDFPVLREGPALPRCMDTVYDDVLAGDAFCGPPMPPAATGFDREAKEDVAGAGAAQEYTAWSVTAAANAGLACFSLGLRRRSPLEWARENEWRDGPALRDMQISPLMIGEATTAWSGRGGGGSFIGSNIIEEGELLHDPTGLVASRDSSVAGALPRSTIAGGSSVGAPRPLLETLTLRGEVEVKLSRKEGEEWHISLPPPHGTFSFAMGPNRELMTVARRNFYCE